MPRLVPFEATGPVELKPQEKSAWICACGLTQNFPHCDGSHKTCRQAETDPAKVYVYGDDKKTIVQEQDKA